MKLTVIKNSVLLNRYVIIFIVITIGIVFLSRCINNTITPVAIKDNQGELFSGSLSCINCHRNVYDSFVHTAHYLTSRIADSNTIKGSFKEGKNVFLFGNSIVRMEKRADSFYQVEYRRQPGNFTPSYQEVNNEPFNIVIGSNTKGQSYLYWKRNSLYQLPLSYFTVIGSWCNSPGYPFSAVYNRTIGARCLECHSTYAKTISPSGKTPEQFDSKQIVYGIDCEKCHGTAARHVAYQTQNPGVKTARYIINPAKLSRQQNLDLCALCHSGGALHQTKSSFSFTAGDTITNYFKRDSTPTDIHTIDVHGNQYGLLRASECFKKSEAMTCNTCHNTHDKERGNIVLFSQRCINCHNSKETVICPIIARLGKEAISTNCIDCHMPLIASKAISVSLPGDTASKSAYVRSHYISIYPDETSKVLSFMKRAN